jgi:Holliday junction resolvasome RuvABC endonuclease subunit
MILALDCATKTGWCLWVDGKVKESGVQDFSKTRGESNGAMFLRFRHWLMDMLGGEPINIVVYEQSHHRGGAATEIGVNLTGRVQEVCAEMKVEYATIHTATLKKFATGDGRASKEDMITASAKLLGRQPIDDNEADAVLMAKWASENY